MLLHQPQLLWLPLQAEPMFGWSLVAKWWISGEEPLLMVCLHLPGSICGM